MLVQSIEKTVCTKYLLNGLFQGHAIRIARLRRRGCIFNNLLKSWMTQFFPRSLDGKWKTGLLDNRNDKWKVKKSHIARAIKIAKNSMPGPDRVPALAFKALGEFATDVLYNAYVALSGDHAVELLTSAYERMSVEQAHAFNASVLCLVPKKPTACVYIFCMSCLHSTKKAYGARAHLHKSLRRARTFST